MDFVVDCDWPRRPAHVKHVADARRAGPAHRPRLVRQDVRYPGDFYMTNEMPWDKDAKGGGLNEREHDEHPDTLTALEGHES